MGDSSVRVEIRTSGIWQTNSVVVSAGGEALIVDPAFFPRELDELAALVRDRCAVATVAFTHGHWDHVAGWRHFPGSAMIGSRALADAIATDAPAAARNLAQLREFDARWYVPRPAPPAWPAGVRGLADGDVLNVGGIQLEALAVPGHSADGLAFFAGELGLLLPGDYLSPCEIPFVEDLGAYRSTLQRFARLLTRIERVIPGHGGVLDRESARAIVQADLVYLEALAECASRGDRTTALSLDLPRAAGVPEMSDRHRENCQAAGVA